MGKKNIIGELTINDKPVATQEWVQQQGYGGGSGSGSVNTSNLVTLDGEQTITGNKTFEGNVDFTDATVSGISLSASDVGLGNVENKSSATIRGELTKENVTDALGYTPPTTDTKYTHPSYTVKSSGLYKITVDATGHVSATTTVAKADITSLGIPSTNTTYSVATTSVAGLIKSTASTVTDGTQFPVTVDSDGKAYITLPVYNGEI